ncbi:MAG: hypothetical protein V4662_26105 [Verrucomicrobiota bacterium]
MFLSLPIAKAEMPSADTSSAAKPGGTLPPSSTDYQPPQPVKLEEPLAPSVPFQDEAKTTFARFFSGKVKTVTDSTILFDVAIGQRWGVIEWMFPRFVMGTPDSYPLTIADQLNGIEFRGIAAIKADAVRVAYATAVPATALAQTNQSGPGPLVPSKVLATQIQAASRKSVSLFSPAIKQLDGKWREPADQYQDSQVGVFFMGGSDNIVAAYWVQRVKGKWAISPSVNEWGSMWKLSEETWLCAKARPQPLRIDEDSLQAEAANAFEMCKRSPNLDGFTLIFRGTEGDAAVTEHVIEFQKTGNAQFEPEKVSTAMRLNGVEGRFVLRIKGGAYRYKAIETHDRRPGEAIPRVTCGVVGTEITGKWRENTVLQVAAEKEGGKWHFTEMYGEVMPAH